MVPRLIQYAEFDDYVHFFCLESFLGKCVPKIQICLKWDLEPRIIHSNYAVFDRDVHFFSPRPGVPFPANLVKKN